MVQPNTRHYRYGEDPFALLCRRVEPFQNKLATHRIYKAVRSTAGLQTFMKNHVFAVWDFMTLTKTLQRSLTCIDTPWLPPSNPLAARLINEIVLCEETDEAGNGEYLSHYAIYLKALDEIGADAGPIQRFEAAIRADNSVEEAFEASQINDATKTFVRSTLSFADGRDHEVAASLLLAREDLIPVMFDRVLREMDVEEGSSQRLVRSIKRAAERLPTRIRRSVPTPIRSGITDFSDDPRYHFRLYLARHVELDGAEHGPMGRRLLMSLC